MNLLAKNNSQQFEFPEFSKRNRPHSTEKHHLSLKEKKKNKLITVKVDALKLLQNEIKRTATLQDYNSFNYRQFSMVIASLRHAPRSVSAVNVHFA